MATSPEIMAYHLAAALFVLWAGLLGAPLISTVAFVSIRGPSAHVQHQAVAIAAAGLFSITALAWLGLSFTI